MVVPQLRHSRACHASSPRRQARPRRQVRRPAAPELGRDAFGLQSRYPTSLPEGFGRIVPTVRSGDYEYEPVSES